MNIIRRLQPKLQSFLGCSSLNRNREQYSRIQVSSYGTAKEAADLNRTARLELAAAYRIFEQMGMHEGICNHLSLMAPPRDGGEDVMLLIPYGLHWREVTASSLIGISSEGKVVEGEGEAETSAFFIHRGIRSIHNHRCVLHIHPAYTTALGCLKDPEFVLCHQTLMRFDGKIAYDKEFRGYGDSDMEGKRLADKLGDKEILMMCTHGVLSAYPTVAEAFDALYYLEKAAQTQVLAMATGHDLKFISSEAVQISQPYMQAFPKMAALHFNALVRLLEKECPEYKE